MALSDVIRKQNGKVVKLKEIDYLTWKSLRRANNRAIRLNLNRQIRRRYINTLDRGNRFPVSLSLFDSGYDGRPDVIRYVITTEVKPDGEPVTCHLDIPLKFQKRDVFSTVLEMDP